MPNITSNIIGCIWNYFHLWSLKIIQLVLWCWILQSKAPSNLSLKFLILITSELCIWVVSCGQHLCLSCCAGKDSGKCNSFESAKAKAHPRGTSRQQFSWETLQLTCDMEWASDLDWGNDMDGFVTLICLIHVWSCIVSRFVYIVFTVNQSHLVDVNHYVVF